VALNSNRTFNVEDCLRCGLCDSVCPTGLSPGTFNDAARRGEVYENAALCTGCGRCQLSCPAGVEPNIIAEPMKGTLESAAYDVIRENVRRYGAVVKPSPSVAPPVPLEKEGDVAYFSGCLATHRLAEQDSAAKRLLSRLGVEFCEIEENCCGSPLRRLGEYELADELLSKNISRIRELGASVVVTSCPGCATTIMEGAPDLQVYHLLEYIDELDVTSSLQPAGGAYSYHLPCHLYRNINPLTREMIENILGNLGEVRRLEHATVCCGAGGLVHLQNPGESAECTAPIMDDLDKSGADMLVTLCPSCYLQFRRQGVDSVDIATVIVDAVQTDGETRSEH